MRRVSFSFSALDFRSSARSSTPLPLVLANIMKLLQFQQFLIVSSHVFRYIQSGTLQLKSLFLTKDGMTWFSLFCYVHLLLDEVHMHSSLGLVSPYSVFEYDPNTRGT